MKRFLHTPEGVRDIYGLECARKHIVSDLIEQNFAKFGYDAIETPTFEFFDVFGREIGTTPSKDLYKFFDKDGNTLVLRPDFTPSIGRCAAKYFMEEQSPVRFRYSGNTFVNQHNLQGKLKENTQMGVELVGDDSVMADAEAIHLAVTSLKASGLKEFQVSIGVIGFFKGICNELQLDADTEDALREFISDKNYFGAEELLNELDLPQDKIDTILKITELFGSAEILDEAQNLVTNEQSKASLKRLQAVYDLLLAYGDEKYVSFDLGLISRYHYYTGIIFKGYTYGVGDAIVTGGRYDSLIKFFGKDAASVGFVINLDFVMQALASRNLLPEVVKDTICVVYELDVVKDAIAYVNECRQLGQKCVLMKMDEDKTIQDYTSICQSKQYLELVKIGKKGVEKFGLK